MSAKAYPSVCLDENKPPMKALYKANSYYFNSDYRSAVKWYLETIRVNPEECTNTGAIEAKGQLEIIKSKIGHSKFKVYKNLSTFNKAKERPDYALNNNRVYNIDDCIKRDFESTYGVNGSHIFKYSCESGDEYYEGKATVKDNLIYPAYYLQALADSKVFNPEGKLELGLRYLDFSNWDDKAKRKKGFKLIIESASSGYVDAQYELALLYDKGSYGIISSDLHAAFKWYKASAQQGHVMSQYEVGAMYYYGEGVRQSYVKAIIWYLKAALQNQADAQYELGQMYSSGQGVSIDYKKAIKWYGRAAEQNDARASDKVKKLLLVKLALNSGFTQQEISKSEGIQNKKAALNFGFTQQEISKSEGIQDSNWARTVRNIDTTPPEIRTYNSDLLTTYDKYVVLAGEILDDSKITKLAINGKEVSLQNNEFSTSEYIHLGRNVFNIIAKDEFGNKSTKIIAFNRAKSKIKNKDKRLLPPASIRNSNPNAIALIIGVDKYESITSAPWAESDASVFYDYAQNALGISDERIRLITGSESSETGIWKSIERWLPTEVDKKKSDVYVYFAGHGLASADGNNAYLIPWDGDPDLLARTAILRSELIDGLKDLDARNVTLFMDTCYSGKARGGKGALVADSRGLRIVKKDKLYDLPSNFTLFSAAGNDETASSHPSLKHGLFSYWMMRGLGGDADSNSDRKITNGELHAFIDKNVQKNAVSMGRKQHPQLVGNKDKVITSW